MRLEELHAAGAVADDGSAGLCQVPGRESLLVREAGEEGFGHGIAQRQEGELVVPVEERDDTRREATQASVRVVQEDRPARVLPSASTTGSGAR